MRILVVTCEWFPDSKGGVARVATDTSRLLAERGHEVTVLAPRLAGAASERAGRLEVRRVVGRRWPRTLTNIVEVERRGRAVRSSPFDVVVAHDATTTLGLRAARLDAPLVRVYHASGLRELRVYRARLPMGKPRLVTYLREPVLALILKAAAASAERVLVLSEFTRSVFVDAHPQHAGRLRRVAGGVDVDRFSPGDGAAARQRLGLPPDATLLLTVRRLMPRMGLEELLRAVAELRDVPGILLAVVGRGMLDASLRRLAAALGIEDRVRFVGSVSDDELVEWYRAADLFVLPTVAEEGFGMVTAEALASGTPVVGTPVGATPELLGPLDPRLVSEGTEPGALAAAIRTTLAGLDDDFRRRCREYACDSFAWERVIPLWEEALADAVAGARAPA